jgi:excisionase family DNA binding protein
MRTDELLSTAEAAKLAGVTRATICRWVKDGTLIPATRLPGGRMTFHRAAVLALITVEAEASA